MVNEIMTINEVATYLQVSRAKVYELINKTQDPLPVIRTVGVASPRISRAVLMGWLNGVFENPNLEIEDSEGGEN